jgi:hypothetical protein
VLIPPRLTHQLSCHGAGLVSCYLEPTSDRGDAGRHKFGEWHSGVGVDLAVPAAQRRVDPRIAAAARRIRQDAAAAISSGELAAAARLSESRFLHLFRDELGTSLRRYRLWVRLIHAGTEGDPFGGPVAMRLGVGGSWSTVERTRLG